MDLLPRRPLFMAAAATLLTSAIWVGLAWRTPTSTFHFAPLIAGVIGPYVAKSMVGPLALAAGCRIAAMSALVVAIAITALVTAHKLQGPTFWSADGASFEAALFAAAGLLLGLMYLSVGREASRGTVPSGPDH